MPAISGSAFHFVLSNGDVESSTYGGILPDPIVLGVTEQIVDGKLETITATSGVEQYIIVDPGDYPTTEEERFRRGGKVKK